MSQIVLDTMALETARLNPRGNCPLPPYGFGRDLHCITDVREDMADVDPNSQSAIGEALLRRLITPRGTLFDDLNYGFDVRGYANRGVPESELRDLAGAIRLECQKDDRVEDLSIAVTRLAANSLAVRVQITPADPSLQPFALTFGIVNGEITTQAFAGQG